MDLPRTTECVNWRTQLEIVHSDYIPRNISGEDNDSDSQNPMQVNQDLIGKNRTLWQALALSHV